MEGFFGKMPRRSPSPSYAHVRDGCCADDDENDMRNWEMQRSDRYAAQTITLGNWLAGINRRPDQPKITTWTNGDVCPSCSNFDIKNAQDGAPTPFSERYALWNHVTSPRQIRQAAEVDKCRRCAVLGQVLHMLGSRGDGHDVRLKFLPASVAMFVVEPEPAYLEIFPADGSPSTACGFPPTNKAGRGRFPAATDAACLEQITMTINECIFSHRLCRPSANPARPNRLVEVPVEDGQPVRIVLASPEAEYAALSHCWGTEPLKRLLKQDVADASTTDGVVTFAWAHLPASFRDACVVARGLFVQHLWIDSLCIVQDDGDDWRREAAKMGAIYEAAYVTIAATDAPASAHGFLFPRFTETSFTAADDDDRHVRFAVREYNLAHSNGRMPHYGDTPEHPWLLRANDLEARWRNPLQQRGWCFQERLMARRVLHVKRYEAVLECGEGYRCECSGMKAMAGRGVKALLGLMMQETLTAPERYRAERLRDAMAREHERGTGRAAAERLATGADARLMQAWEMVVELYSRTAFTHRDDVLPALGALARVFQAARPEWTYVGGLWQEQLRRGLLWVPLSPRESRDGAMGVRTNSHGQGSGHLAPSFSWAARTGRVRYMTGEMGGYTAFEVVAASTVPAGDDAYGDIVGGEVTLRGRAVAFRFWKVEDGEDARGDHEGQQITIRVSRDDWDDPECARSQQDVEVACDIFGPPATWQWRDTNKVESGMETLQRVRGFDTPDEYEAYFAGREPGDPLGPARDELTEEEREHVRDVTPRPEKEPLILFRLTSGCGHGMRGVGAAALMLRRSKDTAGAYRRVGLRVLKDQVFAQSPEMEVRIV